MLCQRRRIGKCVYLRTLPSVLPFNIVLHIIHCEIALYNVTNMDNLKNLTKDDIEGYFNMKNFPNVNILKTKQYAPSMSFCIYFRKHSCLMQPFNEQISLLTSSGLIVSWERAFKNPLYNKHIQMKPNALPLTLNQISGLIRVCIILIALSIKVFNFEVMLIRLETIRIVLDFLSFNTKHNLKLGCAPQIKHSNFIKLNE